MQAEAPSELLHAVDRGEIYDAQVQDTSAGTQSSDSQSSITDQPFLVKELVSHTQT